MMVMFVARVDRMKEAKTEADAAIAQYRSEMEAEYQANLNKHKGSSGSAGNALESATGNDISKMNRDFNSRKESVGQVLVDLVLKVDVKPPVARA
jgi:vacuolar-type H+-ATPase subunit H